MSTNLSYRPAQTKSVSVVKLPIFGHSGTHNYYPVTIPVCDGTQTRKFSLSCSLSMRLWRRFQGCSSCPVVTYVTVGTNNIGSTAQSGTENVVAMLGEGCHTFLQAIVEALTMKHNRNEIGCNWIALPSLYKLWLLTAKVSIELFADCFNESGILQSYCSADIMDGVFGALGSWQNVECTLEGGAANPPFNKSIIDYMVRRFEMGVLGSKSYCRVAVLPLGATYKLISHVNNITSEGELLVTAPAGTFPFLNEWVLLSRDHLRPKPGKYQSVGIFVWCNRAYLVKHRLPADIENLYEVWVHNYLYYSVNVTIHREAFLPAFPPCLRSTESLGEVVMQELLNWC